MHVIMSILFTVGCLITMVMFGRGIVLGNVVKRVTVASLADHNIFFCIHEGVNVILMERRPKYAVIWLGSRELRGACSLRCFLYHM